VALPEAHRESLAQRQRQRRNQNSQLDFVLCQVVSGTVAAEVMTALTLHLVVAINVVQIDPLQNVSIRMTILVVLRKTHVSKAYCATYLMQTENTCSFYAVIFHYRRIALLTAQMSLFAFQQWPGD
jgi:hypothetical protein